VIVAAAEIDKALLRRRDGRRRAGERNG
jgi:hypothetical protein